MWAYFALFVILLIALLWITRVRESFVDVNDMKGMKDIQGIKDIKGIPDPKSLITKLRTMLDTYDKPELYEELMKRSNQDPGELARSYLGIQQ